MRPMPELKVIEIPTSELVEYANNAKLHPHEQVDQIASSIQEFGNNDPIAVWHNENGEPEIVEGHGRLMALRKLGIETAPVIYLDHLTDEQRRAYALVHNKLTMNSDFDLEILSEELAELDMFDMGEFGFHLDTGKIEIEDIDLWPEAQREDVFATELGEANNYVVLEFSTEEDWERAQEVFELERVCTLDKNPNVRRYGMGRVVDGSKWLDRLSNED